MVLDGALVGRGEATLATLILRLVQGAGPGGRSQMAD